ncbi:hypothetical protein COCC4DRAFT_54290 [Bipolaris maydis ATCC 48331]|uniref:Deoxyribonuclease NucA/NucB domain-containing protein n=2 Tax=Cochliobolus heterostrophus TaxID=5016 RepID=M2UCN2_COCH5|nr:uncharacterized protein COCC4DRAFT_54290 [Bipolaris maydis ATCC 48331]EMD85672.1 hypothetical protein COCHEDRAFT_1187409 [Bipolaris maydis C5]KAH7558672.1 hypothetical protein BM1_04809 [Bipolaris maydis]ENH99543.1 hypothetical protein COCC4DRAFT_54290 [Bipolaris maydis ATCC 48331]KAJ5028911.1 deoxyribonuclease NucA/NucB-domain-containing protein [Bipolaris maydis]KAJ5063699.1 deoxyribonuclease NucA/NucB-domain-containing protein [Bipolaris maydis]
MHIHVLYAISLVFYGAGIIDAASFEWDCTNSLGTCNNACYAVNHGLASGTLTYDANKANRGPRRTASGCNRTPCTNTNYNQWGNSCDEYPFASTHEGGAGAILRCVVDTDNDSEGGQLGNFYKKINDGDQFDIFVVNYGGATFCDTPTANNDGSEFRLVNGAFQNAKLRRNMGFMDAVPRISGKKFREFEDENGGRLLLLNQDATIDFVNTQVFSNGTMKTITKEIS